MKIAVLVKQVIGSESVLVISEDNTWVKEENASFVMNPPDNYAIEEGLTIKERIGEGEVVIVSQGPTRVQKVIREGLAKGADRGIHVEENGQIETDPLSIAKSLVAAIKDENFDLILSGLQSDDTGMGQTGILVGELLGMSTATLAIETDIDMLLISPEDFEQCWDKVTQNNILRALNACPNGVIRMSDDIEGIVESSLNLGVIQTRGKKLNALVLIRSLHDDGRLETQRTVQSVFELAGADIGFSGAYPGWKPNPESAIMKTVSSTYQELFGKIPEIMVIHAGLECGLFKTAYPHWDMVSIGPTIKFPHSPDEKIEIATVEQYWQLLVAVLAKAPKK